MFEKIRAVVTKSGRFDLLFLRFDDEITEFPSLSFGICLEVLTTHCLGEYALNTILVFSDLTSSVDVTSLKSKDLLSLSSGMVITAVKKDDSDLSNLTKDVDIAFMRTKPSNEDLESLCGRLASRYIISYGQEFAEEPPVISFRPGATSPSCITRRVTVGNAGQSSKVLQSPCDLFLCLSGSMH